MKRGIEGEKGRNIGEIWRGEKSGEMVRRRKENREKRGQGRRKGKIERERCIQREKEKRGRGDMERKMKREIRKLGE